MQTTFNVEIFAIAVGVEGNCGGVGQISHHLEIITETDILYLPVIACILFQINELALLIFRTRNNFWKTVKLTIMWNIIFQ